ncbi:MAG: DUF4123 domain-containing protein, partial [Gemmatimonadota bacterium]
DTPAVLRRVDALGSERSVSLYKGTAEESLRGIAPYLVRLDFATYDWLVESEWTEPWGILVLADGDLDTLRRHFRRFLIVESPNGDPWYFRFYDPRVLTKFLPTLDHAGVDDFFGPVRAFGAVDPMSYGVRITTIQTDPASGRSRPVVVKRLTETA